MKIQFDARLELDDLRAALKKRGLTPGGKVQKVVDNAVLRYCDPKVPMDTGMLKDSGPMASAVGDGLLVYATPYAAKMYENPQFHFQGAPERGAYWFTRAMAEHREDVVREAAAAAGGRPGQCQAPAYWRSSAPGCGKTAR